MAKLNISRRFHIVDTESNFRSSFFLNRLKGAFKWRFSRRGTSPPPVLPSGKNVMHRNKQSAIEGTNLVHSNVGGMQSPRIAIQLPSSISQPLSRSGVTEVQRAAFLDAIDVSAVGAKHPGAQEVVHVEPDVAEHASGFEKDVRNQTAPCDSATLEASLEAAAKGASEIHGVSMPFQRAAVLVNEVDNFVFSILDALGKFSAVVKDISKIHPYAHAAWSVLSFASKAIEDQKNRDQSIVSLLQKIHYVYTFLNKAEVRDIKAMKVVVEQICCQTLECTYFIREYTQNKKFRTRLLKNLISQTETRVEEYNKAFDELLLQFRNRAIGDTLVVVHRIWDQLDTLVQDTNLQHMPYVQGAGLNLQKICLEGTREQILKDIIDWVNLNGEDDASCIFWLHGNAGSGKSSIAHTIAKYFEKLGRLGSCFCFDRNKLAEERHNKIFTVIAQDLVRSDKNLRAELAGIVHLNKALSNTSDIIQQWTELVVKPLRRLSETMVGPIVIVIDALDESGNPDSRRNLLRILAGALNDDDNHVLKLPPQVRIVLTSRALPDISNAFNGINHVYSMSMDSISSESTSRDIFCYVSAELQDLNVEQKVLERLSSASDGLFEWARLACAYIKGDDDAGFSIRERIDDVFAHNQAEQATLLDSMYMLTLGTVFPDNQHKRAVRLERFRSVMAQVLGSAEPLSLAALASMRRHFMDEGLKEISIETIIKPMGALLSGTISSSTVIRPLHASFPEFLMDKERSGEFFIDLAQIHVNLAVASLRVMKEQLQFNICQLPSSYLPNSEVEDLDQRIKNHISLDLSYSSRFWTYHLQHAKYCAILVKTIQDFFNDERLLFWIEILSLLKLVNTCAGSMLSIIQWAKAYRNCEDILNYATDVQNFVRTFGSAITYSTPHLYLSALPFSPERSHINMTFGNRFCNMLHMDFGRSMSWPILQETLKGHDGGVTCVAFSLDGHSIVSGSTDKKILLWDAETGEQIGAPLEGHQNWVQSIAFSPDGKNIVSGSSDKTLLLWNAKSKIQAGAPLQGHQESVRCVAFSPDGKFIISGSWDNTLVLWDAKTGKQIGMPFRGHQHWVQSIAFSPNGRQIVSGSFDKTLRLWDVITGKQIGAAFEGHQGSVQSVAFSPDGKWIVSGSHDKTLRLWNAKTREQIRTPLEGHKNPVHCVAFSPNGKFIISGSWDNTLLLWNAETGKQINTSFEGHQDWVLSVAFSPDGKRIVSGSLDKTLRLWNIETNEQINIPVLKSHQKPVQSIAFSPDGHWIVSGSHDKTLCLWDAKIGKQIGAPFKGHWGNVHSVAFSPDGKYIVSGSDDMTLQLWDVATRKHLKDFKGHQDSVWSIAFSPDGKYIVSGSSDKTLRLWNAKTGKQIGAPFEGHQDYVMSVAFSPNGKYIISGSYDSTIRLWDTLTGKQVGASFEGHQHWVQSVAFSPDGKCIVSGSHDNTLCLWDIKSGQQLGAPLEGHQKSIQSVAFSPNGKNIISGSEDQTLRLWDTATRQQIGIPFEGHQGSIYSVAFSPDGMYIVSSSSDKTIRLWNINSIFAIQNNVVHNSLSFSCHPQLALPTTNVIFQYVNILSHQTQTAHNPIISSSYSWQGHGWVVSKSINSKSRLLFFVPSIYNLQQYWPPSLKLIMPPPPQLDLSQMVHGELWTLIYPNPNILAV